jgi:SAM-dependent methyltransferase
MGLRDQVEAIVSAGGLHWVGDIVGALTQVKHLLKPDGVFVGAVLGGDSLFELRYVHHCYAADWKDIDTIGRTREEGRNRK